MRRLLTSERLRPDPALSLPSASLHARSRKLLAAVDLGSNSFRLLIGRVVKTPAGTQVYPLDSLKETVRLASGLTKEKKLDAESQQRGLVVLERFGDRLRSFAPHTVRAVATNTLRVAKNAREFLGKAEAALGFPIEVIAGREEARLIYTGVANTAPLGTGSTLVVDIGGGSTEFIIGEGHEPRLMESLFMGCVSYSLRFFPDGEIDKHNLKLAELAAQKELEVIARDYIDAGWQNGIGSSGTARALGEILEQNGLAAQGITRDGLAATARADAQGRQRGAAQARGAEARSHPGAAGRLRDHVGDLQDARPRGARGHRRGVAAGRALRPARPQRASRHARRHDRPVHASLRGRSRAGAARRRAGARPAAAADRPARSRPTSRSSGGCMGGDAARDRAVDLACRVSQALGLHPVVCRHARLLEDGPGEDRADGRSATPAS